MSDLKPGLRLAEVRIEDFRALRDVRVPLGDTTLLVGANNSGKTSFLEALAIALTVHRPDEADFHVSPDGSVAARFLVDLRLEPATGREFPEDLAQVFGNAVQFPKEESPCFVAVRTLVNAQADGTTDLQRRYLRGWPRSRADKVAELPGQPSREALETVAFTMLDARRDVVEEMRSRRSWWGRLTSRLEMKPETARDIENALAALGSQIIEGSSLLTRVRDDLQRVQTALGATEVSISPLAVRVDDLSKGMDVILQASQSASLPIARQGMGTRSLASLLVFRTFVQVRLAAGGGRPPLAVTALEEPEAHIHPQGHRAVFRLISEIPGQRLISTHSPFVAAPADVFDFRVFGRKGPEVVCRWIDRARPDGAPTFTDDELQKLQQLVLRRSAEALFARVVVLFEGETEAVTLPVFARKRWSDPDAAGISLVDMGGAGNLRHAVRLLQPLGIPWVILADGDKAGKDALAGVRVEIGAAENLDIPAISLTSGGAGLKLEMYLLAEGHGTLIQEAIASEFGATALASYEKLCQGQVRKDGVRDYSGVSGRNQLLCDFMDHEKVRCGRAFAELANHRNVMPRAVQELFDRVDAVLKDGPA